MKKFTVDKKNYVSCRGERERERERENKQNLDENVMKFKSYVIPKESQKREKEVEEVQKMWDMLEEKNRSFRWVRFTFDVKGKFEHRNENYWSISGKIIVGKERRQTEKLMIFLYIKKKQKKNEENLNFEFYIWLHNTILFFFIFFVFIFHNLVSIFVVGNSKIWRNEGKKKRRKILDVKRFFL